MKHGVIVRCPIKISASEKIVRTSFTLKGTKRFFIEGENLKQKVDYAREIA
jgi:hypothetical protein